MKRYKEKKEQLLKELVSALENIFGFATKKLFSGSIGFFAILITGDKKAAIGPTRFIFVLHFKNK